MPANPNALKDAHSQFSNGGYNGSIKDFYSLLQSNPQAFEDSYKKFLEGGYNGTINDYEELIGLKEVITKKVKEVVEEVIDIKNKALSPGFIDMHAHDDIAMFVYPDMDFKLMQGVTTNVNGNCGSGVIPHSSADIINWHPNFDGIPEWSSYGEYLELVDKSKTSIHSAFLVGHGPIRKATTGNEKRMPTQSEFDAAANLEADAQVAAQA